MSLKQCFRDIAVTKRSMSLAWCEPVIIFRHKSGSPQKEGTPVVAAQATVTIEPLFLPCEKEKMGPTDMPTVPLQLD